MPTPRRPSMADRSMSSPLSVNTSVAAPNIGLIAMPSRLGLSLLTPPSSPRHSRSSSDLSTKTDDSIPEDSLYDPKHRGIIYSGTHRRSSINERTPNGTIICPYEVEILKDQRNRNQIFGYGAWSTVFRATCCQKPTSGLLTPPLSPRSSPPLLVAIKQPARKDAKNILENEASILSYLMNMEGSENHIVPFHGIILSTQSLVLTALPLSLDEHIKNCARTAQASRSTMNMCDPVVGSVSAWLELAYELISALSWLHDTAGVVHGDVKPGNILLDRLNNADDMEISNDISSFQYRPLLIDFSSSQRTDGAVTRNTLSALTREYAAPELLSSKVLSNPDSTATKASDVFSMAVTLLVGATGNTMVYSGSVYQRQAMAIQGWQVIQSVRNGPMEEGARVPRRGAVERLLERAVLRDDKIRIDATVWKANTKDMMRYGMGNL